MAEAEEVDPIDGTITVDTLLQMDGSDISLPDIDHSMLAQLTDDEFVTLLVKVYTSRGTQYMNRYISKIAWRIKQLPSDKVSDYILQIMQHYPINIEELQTLVGRTPVDKLCSDRDVVPSLALFIGFGHNGSNEGIVETVNDALSSPQIMNYKQSKLKSAPPQSIVDLTDDTVTVDNPQKLNVRFFEESLGLTLRLTDDAQISVVDNKTSSEVKRNDILIGVNGKTFVELDISINESSFQTTIGMIKAMRRPVQLMFERWNTASSHILQKSSAPRLTSFGVTASPRETVPDDQKIDLSTYGDEQFIDLMFKVYLERGARYINGFSKEIKWRINKLPRQKKAEYMFKIMQHHEVSLEGLRAMVSETPVASLCSDRRVKSSLALFIGFGHNKSNDKIVKDVNNAATTDLIQDYSPPKKTDQSTEQSKPRLTSFGVAVSPQETVPYNQQIDLDKLSDDEFLDLMFKMYVERGAKYINDYMKDISWRINKLKPKKIAEYIF